MAKACRKHWDYESFKNFNDIPCKNGETCNYCFEVENNAENPPPIPMEFINNAN